MKKMRSLLSVAITAIMMLCLCSFNVSADDTYTITINVPTGSSDSTLIDGRTFTAYKVFALSYSGNSYNYTLDSSCLSPGGYGTGYGLDTVTSWTNDPTDEPNVREFATHLYNTYIKGKTIPDAVDKAFATASSGSATITVSNAGYYIVVEDSSDNGLTSLVMLGSTAPNVDIEAKIGSTGMPTLKKSISYNNTGWGQPASDTQIGEMAAYEIELTVPDTYYVNQFENYTYTVHDTIDSGLTYNQYIFLMKHTEAQKDQSQQYCTVNFSGNQMTVEIKLKDLIQAWNLQTGDKIYLYYNAILNKNAKVATDAGDNTNHNINEAYLEYSIDPYDTSKTATTPHIKTYDWTYQFSVEKVDEGGNHLEGAEFEIKNGSDTLKFSNTSSNEYTVDPAGSITKITTDDTGKFVIRGIDQEVTYTIKETKAPDGYGLPDSDATIILNATYKIDGSEINTLTGTIRNAKNPSGFNVIIENTSGAKLVGTGGMGTTVFYVFGGILMAGAAVLLTVKIRIKNK